MQQPNRWIVPTAIAISVVVGFVLRAYMPPMPMWLMLVLLVVLSTALAALIVYARRRASRVEAKR
jgi:hypothetical protein